MTILITVIHVIVCLFLIAVVLLQSGKSGDLAAAFGGQGSQTAFGPRGAAKRTYFRPFGSQTFADQVTAGDTRAVRTASRPTKSGAYTEVIHQ